MPTVLTVSDIALTILRRSTAEGDLLSLPDEQLDRDAYLAVAKITAKGGGKWNRSRKGIVFAKGDAEDWLEQVLLTGHVSDERRQFDIFYTPPDVVKQVIDHAGIPDYCRVLEPSAGEGALALAAARAAEGVLVDAIEIRSDTSDWWEAEQLLPGGIAAGGVRMNRPADFLAVVPDPQALFDRVVMNPPFSRQQDMAHVIHAHRFLRPGGRLVAVMSPAWRTRTSRQADTFRSYYAEHGLDDVDLPDDAFASAGTRVRTTIVVLGA
jgi:predicted RNA methylase